MEKMSPTALLYYYMGFPGLGIRDFHIDTTAIQIGDLRIQWYGLIIVCGMIAAVVYTYLHARRHSLIFDDIIDIALSSIIPGVIGARLYYVFFDWLDNPEKYVDFIDIIAIWEGGLAIYGGLIFGVLGAVIAMKIKKIRIPMMLDCAFPGILLAQAMGRWGNFVNMEAYGAETTWFCRMRLSSESGLSFTEVHPTFLYESLWNLIGFIILTLLFKKRKFDGQIFLMAVSWYGFGRFFIEGLRQDSLMIGEDIRVSQLLAGVLFVVAMALLIVCLVKYKKRHVARCIYIAGSPKYVPVIVSKDEDPEYDYDMNALYAKNVKTQSEESKQDAPAPDESVDSAEDKSETQDDISANENETPEADTIAEDTVNPEKSTCDEPTVTSEGDNSELPEGGTEEAVSEENPIVDSASNCNGENN